MPSRSLFSFSNLANLLRVSSDIFLRSGIWPPNNLFTTPKEVPVRPKAASILLTDFNSLTILSLKSKFSFNNLFPSVSSFFICWRIRFLFVSAFNRSFATSFDSLVSSFLSFSTSNWFWAILTNLLAILKLNFSSEVDLFFNPLSCLWTSNRSLAILKSSLSNFSSPLAII